MSTLEALDRLEAGWRAAKAADWTVWAADAEAFCLQLGRLQASDEALVAQLRRRVHAMHAQVALTLQFHRELNSPESSDYSPQGTVSAGRLRPRLIIQG